MRLRKNGVRVSFPKILDLAPYCSKACINLPSIQPDQTSILYRYVGPSLAKFIKSSYNQVYEAYEQKLTFLACLICDLICAVLPHEHRSS